MFPIPRTPCRDEREKRTPKKKTDFVHFSFDSKLHYHRSFWCIGKA